MQLNTFASWYLPYCLKHIESVSVVVYCNGDILSTSEGILFECHSGPKFITISEDMSLDALRKIIMDAIEGCIILLDQLYHQHV